MILFPVMKPTTPSISPRTVIDGKYEVVRLIGRGGMGAVYEALSRLTRRRVAIKILNERYLDIPEVVERFQRESQVAAAIGHDNICEVIDAGCLDSGVPFLVMPLLTGMPLGRLLKTRQTPMSEARLVVIIAEALDGLAAAHDAGVIHRDLKPDNIFVTTGRNRPDGVKLLDFGVSKVVNSAAVEGEIRTKEGAIIGTPAYMAPEQAGGHSRVDHRIDIYAMGVVLYEIMTGTLPHHGATSREMILKIIAEPFLSPRRINPDISAKMEAVILKAMAKSPDDRFEHAREMKAALNRAAGHASIPPGRPAAAPTAVPPLDTPFQSGEVVLPHTETDTEIPSGLIRAVDARHRRLMGLLVLFVLLTLLGAGAILIGIAEKL